MEREKLHRKKILAVSLFLIVLGIFDCRTPVTVKDRLSEIKSYEEEIKKRHDDTLAERAGVEVTSPFREQISQNLKAMTELFDFARDARIRVTNKLPLTDETFIIGSRERSLNGGNENVNSFGFGKNW